MDTTSKNRLPKSPSPLIGDLTDNLDSGEQMYLFLKDIFPICRSITGNGVRKTFKLLQTICPDITLYEVPSGTKVFDWVIPKEWNIEEAYIEDEEQNRIVDFNHNNLHVVGYSAPMDRFLTLDELQPFLYSLPKQPDVIPYVTSYYKERSGFCLSDKQRKDLKPGIYHAVIKSNLNSQGSLTYGELIIPGKSEKEILVSTYICHPSMANNECSGPVVSCFLADWIKSLETREYTYRFLFIPETIGSITYLSKNYSVLKKHVIAGFNLSCVGDDETYSIVESKYGNTLTDKILHHILRYYYPQYKTYSFLDRGSDERQYNAPGIDLPVCGVCRTKYGEYPQYHTSADDLSLVTPNGLGGTLQLMKNCVTLIEHNKTHQTTCLCEPQLGKRGLYPSVSQKGSSRSVKTIMDFLAYADGKNTLLDIAELIQVSALELIPIAENLYKQGLIVSKP